MSDRLKRALDSVLSRGVESGAVPGVVAAVTTRDGVIYEGAFGRRGLDAATPMTADTVCSLASMNKALSAFAVMQLVGRGVLDLDAPTGDLVPYLRDVQVLDGFTGEGQPILRAPATPVTLRHLLTHTSGFAYNWCSAKQQRFTEVTGYDPKGIDRYNTPLMFDPGTSYQYGVGFDWATRVLEAATGHRLVKHMQANVFEPLGMDAGWTVTGEARNRTARIHRRDAGGALSVEPGAPPEHLDFETGGGGIFSTAGDYLKFVRMILNGGTHQGERLIAEAALAEMLNPAAAPGNSVLPIAGTNPSVNSGGFFPGLPQRHSIGFVVNEAQAPTGRSAGSLSWGGFFNTYYWIDPARGIGGVYLTQLIPFLDTRSVPLFLDFETATYGALGG